MCGRGWWVAQNMRRNLINTLRHRSVAVVLALASLALGLIFGTLYYQQVRRHTHHRRKGSRVKPFSNR